MSLRHVYLTQNVTVGFVISSWTTLNVYWKIILLPKNTTVNIAGCMPLI
jgi:hypothetical protein